MATGNLNLETFESTIKGNQLAAMAGIQSIPKALDMNEVRVQIKIEIAAT
jgi:hypothetical protein